MENLHRHVSSHHSFMYLWIVGAVLVFGGLIYSYLGSHPQGVIDGTHEGDVRSTVAAFGNQLNSVSRLSPHVADEIRAAYGPYVSEPLLAAWVANPEAAPGRITSSPWPDHIEVDTVTLTESGSYDVTGRVMLLSSTGDAGSVPVFLTVADSEAGYRITSYEEGTAPHETPSERTISLALQETGTVSGITLTPLTLEEDSRCPSDVVCIQAGTVRVSVRIEEAGAVRTEVLTLGEANGAITLSAVEPYPIAAEAAERAAYRFTFIVER